MRSTCEIIADVKDGKEVPYEELKMACLVQSSIIFDIVNIGLHFFLKNVRPYAASCSEA